MTPDLSPAEIDAAAAAIMHCRGFGYATTPEDGQDLYDISTEARQEAEAALTAAAWVRKRARDK